MKFFSLLNWLDGRPLLEVMEPYRQQIHTEFLYTFRADGSLRYRRGLKGRSKKTSKTTDEILEDLYRLLSWRAAGNKGNQVYHTARDLGQANDGLDDQIQGRQRTRARDPEAGRVYGTTDEE